MLLGVIAWWLYDFMPASTGSLENRAEDKQGVISVAADTAEGDGLPFPLERAASSIKITMGANSTAREINDVLHAYDGDIDDGDVDSVYLVVDGAKPGSLSLGEDIHASDAIVEELVGALRDPEITSYYREAYPVLPR